MVQERPISKRTCEVNFKLNDCQVEEGQILGKRRCKATGWPIICLFFWMSVKLATYKMGAAGMDVMVSSHPLPVRYKTNLLLYYYYIAHAYVCVVFHLALSKEGRDIWMFIVRSDDSTGY